MSIMNNKILTGFFMWFVLAFFHPVIQAIPQTIKVNRILM